VYFKKSLDLDDWIKHVNKSEINNVKSNMSTITMNAFFLSLRRANIFILGKMQEMHKIKFAPQRMFLICFFEIVHASDFQN